MKNFWLTILSIYRILGCELISSVLELGISFYIFISLAIYITAALLVDELDKYWLFISEIVLS
jgi:hypothetical protein